MVQGMAKFVKSGGAAALDAPVERKK